MEEQRRLRWAQTDRAQLGALLADHAVRPQLNLLLPLQPYTRGPGAPQRIHNTLATGLPKLHQGAFWVRLDGAERRQAAGAGIPVQPEWAATEADLAGAAAAGRPLEAEAEARTVNLAATGAAAGPAWASWGWREARCRAFRLQGSAVFGPGFARRAAALEADYGAGVSAAFQAERPAPPALRPGPGAPLRPGPGRRDRPEAYTVDRETGGRRWSREGLWHQSDLLRLEGLVERCERDCGGAGSLEARVLLHLAPLPEGKVPSLLERFRRPGSPPALAVPGRPAPRPVLPGMGRSRPVLKRGQYLAGALPAQRAGRGPRPLPASEEEALAVLRQAFAGRLQLEVAGAARALRDHLLAGEAAVAAWAELLDHEARLRAFIAAAAQAHGGRVLARARALGLLPEPVELETAVRDLHRRTREARGPADPGPARPVSLQPGAGWTDRGGGGPGRTRAGGECTDGEVWL